MFYKQIPGFSYYFISIDGKVLPVWKELPGFDGYLVSIFGEIIKK